MLSELPVIAKDEVLKQSRGVCHCEQSEAISVLCACHCEGQSPEAISIRLLTVSINNVPERPRMDPYHK